MDESQAVHLAAATVQPSLPQTTDLAAATADLLGQPNSSADMTNATPEAKSAGLAALYNELDDIPLSEKAALVYVQQTKPELVGDDEVFRFLLVENFKAREAARRLVRYWNERYRLFGQDKFCLPLTLKGALKDDSLALSRGYVQILPQADTAGRAVIYVDWSCHEPSIGYSVESMHRVFWYIVHVAMEDIEVLKRGLVLLIYPQEARLDQFDHSLWKSIAESCKYSLPIQWKSTHIVHPNRFFSIIHPLFMSTLPKTVQDRVVVHSGTKMKVLANLLRYCLPWDRIPSDVGGCVDLDFGKWLSERMIKEDKMSSVSQGATTSQGGVGNLLAQLTGQSQLAQATQLMQTAPLGLGSSIPTLPLPDQAMSAAAHPLFGGNKNQLLLNLTHPTGNITNVPLETIGPTYRFEIFHRGSPSMPVIAGGSKSSKKKDKASDAPAKGKATNVKSGRKSDPRMDRAVEAKLADPSMSLLDALRAGGFEIPSSSSSSAPQYVVVDGDNVKITQRKNQLLRRLRTVKKEDQKNCNEV
ncbi:hypothetical protein HJC23_013837 [Cyclotella cryptica]|uniref:CRAL-TRIO domain-containing protein n=1 Tax=Cyclotella cryptica TaxID=29204 RepID=A0ABD3P9U1_9STRA